MKQDYKRQVKLFIYLVICLDSNMMSPAVIASRPEFRTCHIKMNITIVSGYLVVCMFFYSLSLAPCLPIIGPLVVDIHLHV